MSSQSPEPSSPTSESPKNPPTTKPAPAKRRRAPLPSFTSISPPPGSLPDPGSAPASDADPTPGAGPTPAATSPGSSPEGPVRWADDGLDNGPVQQLLDGPREEADPKLIKGALKQGLKTFGNLANRWATRTQDEFDHGVWIVGPTHSEDIASPAARILARRGVYLPADALDLIKIFTAAADWLDQNLWLKRQLRGQAAGMDLPAEPDSE